ncbi:MAG: glycosyltransferase family 39 protein [Flavobacteriales bacterium]|nr:glycosyltransferase family 39 protein [Flavobacteriales bacterium]
MSRVGILNIETRLLGVILLVAAILRFYNYGDLSITADEISALLRLRVDNFTGLIDFGVRPDGHPAGVQVFLYLWTSMFGISEASLRFPFVLSGILAVFFSYKVSKVWFNKNAGLFVAASMCFLQFPLLHSQIARPYSPGLAFTLGATWFWSLVLFYPSRYKTLKVLALGFFAAAAFYTHYFSFLMVLIIGLTGLIFLNKTNFKPYLAALGLVFVLFAPHFGVSMDHLTIGGLAEAEWLGSPDQKGNWLGEYVLYAFNNSPWLLTVFILLCFGSILYKEYEPGLGKFRWLALIWFLLPFLIGYCYSVFVNPVLQRSVLLFSFPFLLILLFSLIPAYVPGRFLTVAVLGFLTLGMVSTIVLNRFYQGHNFGVLKELAESAIYYEDIYGGENITKALNVSHPYLVEYDLNKHGRTIDYLSYLTENQGDRYINNGREKLADFRAIVGNSVKPYFLYQWSSKYSPVEIPEIIMEKYPYLVDRKYYFNSEVYLFSRDSTQGRLEKPVYLNVCDFENGLGSWQGSESGIVNSKSGTKAFKMRADDKFSPVFIGKISDLMTHRENIIHLSLLVKMAARSSDVIMVIELQSPDGVGYNWNGINVSYFYSGPDTWFKAFHSIRFHHIQSADDLVKIYVWNNEGVQFTIDDLQIKVTEGNPIIFGKRDISL